MADSNCSTNSASASAITSEAYRNLPNGNVQGSLEWLYELFDATIACVLS
jgi:hypothetical protein